MCNRKGYIVSVFVLALSAFLFVKSAEARHFKVYGANTLKSGEMELVYWTDYVAQSDQTMPFFGKTVNREELWGHTLELEYGVTDRWTISGYMDYEQPSGESLKYIQSRAVLTRYRFFEPGERFFDAAIYLEYYLTAPGYDVAKEKIEARIILQREIGPTTLTLNPKLEKVMSGDDVGEGMEFAYGLSLYYNDIGLLKPGIEFYGSLGEIVNTKSFDAQKHYVVPSVKWNVMDHISWNLGVGFGLTDASDDVVVKSIVAYEF